MNEGTETENKANLFKISILIKGRNEDWYPKLEDQFTQADKQHNLSLCMTTTPKRKPLLLKLRVNTPATELTSYSCS